MEREEFGEQRSTALRFGGQKLNLRPKEATQEAWISSVVAEPGTQDLCFIVTVSADDVVTHLRGCSVAVELGPVPKQGALGPMTSVYCRDPDGNLIEIATYGDRFAE
jgi:catechol 2,3-dioxygenase-like lactoylglutathione lyase family enzyme